MLSDSFFSYILYISFFLAGYIIDLYVDKPYVRKLYVFSIFIFLCFGYMTGSDWRSYELDYEDALYCFRYSTYDKGFWAIYYLLSTIISDFFVTLGLLKCLYLYSLIVLLRNITKHWLLVISIMFSTSLLFMVVNNPLRFMCANIFINFGLVYAFKGNIRKFLIIAIWSVFLHATSIILILSIVGGFYVKNVAKVNNHLLFVLYLIISFLMSNVGLVESLFFIANDTLVEIGSKSYDAYAIQSNDSFFTIGSLLRIIFGMVIIYNCDIILKANNGRALFAFTIVFLYMDRLCLIVPTGFRLVIPLGIFYAVSISYIITSKRKIYSYFLLLATFLILSRSLYSSYVYIPYSNSIPYILTSHKSYYERSNYNYDKYRERTGKVWE